MVEPGRILVLPSSFVSNIETNLLVWKDFDFLELMFYITKPTLYVYVVFLFLCQTYVKCLSYLCHRIVTVLSRFVMLYVTYLNYPFGLFGDPIK